MMRAFLMMVAVLYWMFGIRSYAQRQARSYTREVDQSGWEVASANRTTNAQTTAFDTSDFERLGARLNVTAVGAAPSLTVTLETSYDGGTTWFTAGSWPAKTAIGADERGFGPIGPLCRWAWTVTAGGVTFQVDRVTGVR